VLHWSYVPAFPAHGREALSVNSYQRQCKVVIECANAPLESADETTRTHMNVPLDYVRAYWLLGRAYRANHELTLAEENLSKALNLCREINAVGAE